jgi:NagD protein
MDGVLYHGNRLLPGAHEFVNWLQSKKKRFLFLTNNSEKSPRELQEKLQRLGISVGIEHFYTSALATANFLAGQKPNDSASAYVIGATGLTNALYDAGFSMNDINPDYVIVGETRTYSFEMIERAVNLVLAGAKLIGTNPDLSGPIETGITVGCGALVAPIELAAGIKAYFVGKPNPIMMRHARRLLGCKREEAAIIGDRMDTDIIAGIHADIDTVLVLSGVTSRRDLRTFAYHPRYVLKGVGDIPA